MNRLLLDKSKMVNGWNNDESIVDWVVNNIHFEELGRINGGNGFCNCDLDYSHAVFF